MEYQHVTDEWCNRPFIKEQNVKRAQATHGASEYKAIPKPETQQHPFIFLHTPYAAND